AQDLMVITGSENDDDPLPVFFNCGDLAVRLMETPHPGSRSVREIQQSCLRDRQIRRRRGRRGSLEAFHRRPAWEGCFRPVASRLLSDKPARRFSGFMGRNDRKGSSCLPKRPTWKIGGYPLTIHPRGLEVAYQRPDRSPPAGNGVSEVPRRTPRQLERSERHPG